MSKQWADWCISDVRYNADHTRIVKVMVRLHNGETIGAPVEKTRQQVIDAIEAQMTIITITKQDGKWRRGAEVGTVTIDKEQFLRTDKNNRRVDNLGELPEY